MPLTRTHLSVFALIATLTGCGASADQVAGDSEDEPETGLTKADVNRVIRDSFDDVRHCATYSRPGGHGKVRIRFEIQRDGSVSNASVVSDDHANADLSGCIRDVVAGLTFPTHAGEPVGVTYPFHVDSTK